MSNIKQAQAWINAWIDALNEERSDLLAALVYLRFGGSPTASAEAWERLLQSPGLLDSPTIHREWRLMVDRGILALKDCGFIGPEEV